MCIYIYVYTCIYICVCTYTYIYIYVYIYAYPYSCTTVTRHDRRENAFFELLHKLATEAGCSTFPESLRPLIGREIARIGRTDFFNSTRRVDEAREDVEVIFFVLFLNLNLFFLFWMQFFCLLLFL